MAKVGAQRAAELTGKSKSTIQRAMKSGKISYEMDNNGRRVIDVAELERAFGIVPQDSGSTADNVETELQKAKDMLEMERMKMRLKMLEEQVDLSNQQIEDLKQQRDQWQKQAQQVLITSQYSQKQTEELKTEMKERERRFRAYRKQENERRTKSSGMPAQKSKTAAESAQKQAASGKGFDIQGLWHKIRGQDEEEKQKIAA